MQTLDTYKPRHYDSSQCKARTVVARPVCADRSIANVPPVQHIAIRKRVVSNHTKKSVAVPLHNLSPIESIPDYCFSTKRAYNRQNRPEPFTPNTQPARNMSAGCTRTPTMADAAVTRA